MDTRNINTIKVGQRFRKDMGDIAALAKSIDALGLLHPIVIDEQNNLIAGSRRLMAVRELHWDMVPVNVVNLDDPQRAERDENEERKPFTVSERVAIGQAIEVKEKELAKERMLAGKTPDAGNTT